MGEYKFRAIVSHQVFDWDCDWVGTAGLRWYQQRSGPRRIDGIDDVLGTHVLLIAVRRMVHRYGFLERKQDRNRWVPLRGNLRWQ
jgi:hypothetical protein